MNAEFVRLMLCTCGWSAALIPTSVHAQTASAVNDPAPNIASAEPGTQATPPAATSPVDTGDIVVTAQRREERLQNVGVAVAAYSGATLRDQAVRQATDIASFTPGVTASINLGGQGQQFSIRGVTQSDFNDTLEAPVAVYVDDTYVASQQGQALALFDISRVEALKGPQGTLFGRNATGGLINFVVNQPNVERAEGFIDASYGRFQQRTVEAALNLPIDATLAVRGSFFYNENDAIYDNKYPAGVAAGAPLTFNGPPVSPAGQDLGGARTLAGRLQLLWKPTSDVSVRVTGSISDQHLSAVPYFSDPVVAVVDAQGRVVNTIQASPTETRSAIGPDGGNYYNPAVLGFQKYLYSPNGDGRRAPGASWFGYTAVPGQRSISEDFALSDLNRFRVYNGAAHVDWDLGGVQVAYVSSYYEYKKKFLMDADASPVDVYLFGTRSGMKTFSNELRFSGSNPGFTWTAGLYQLHISGHSAYGLLAPRGSAFADFFGLGAVGVDPVDVYSIKDNSVSPFGQVSWEFVPKLTVVVGARAINERQTYDFITIAARNDDDYNVDSSTVLFPLSAPFHDHRSNWLWAGKAQLEYRPTSDILLYGGVNRGSKAGNYNAKLFDGSPALSDDQIPYDSETLTSYEGGFKTSGSHGLFTLNGSIYRYVYNGYQSYVFSTVSGYVQNKDARTTGAELEGTLRPVQGLRLTASGAYVDAKVLSLQIAPGVFRTTRPTFSPKYQASLRVDYAFPSPILGGDLNLGVSVGYQSSFYQNARNFDADKLEGRTLTDIYLNWKVPNGLRLGGYVNNLFNVNYRSSAFDVASTCGCSVTAYGRPVSWGLRAGYTF